MNTSSRPTLTRQDRQQLLSQALTRPPLPGERAHSGVLAGVACVSTLSQRRWYHTEMKRMQRRGVAA